MNGQSFFFILSNEYKSIHNPITFSWLFDIANAHIEIWLLICIHELKPATNIVHVLQFKQFENYFENLLL